MSEKVSSFLETLRSDQQKFLISVTHLDDPTMVLDLDLDNVASDTDPAILTATDKKLGTSYAGRKFLSYYSLQIWLVEDGRMSASEASKFDRDIWADPDVLMQANPNPDIQRLSKAASERGIAQYVTTARSVKASEATLEWLGKHYPWIPEANINRRKDDSVPGIESKTQTLLELAEANSNLVHLDDSMNTMVRLNILNPKIGRIGFPYPDDSTNGLSVASNHIVIPDIGIMRDLIPFKSAS